MAHNCPEYRTSKIITWMIKQIEPALANVRNLRPPTLTTTRTRPGLSMVAGDCIELP